MLHRSIIIMVCISLVGVTALPASLIPCCCKTGGKMLHSPKASPGCCTKKAVSPCCRSMAAPAASCPMHAAQPQAFSFGDSLTKNCPHCRCLEQMQVVALSGYSVHNGTATWTSVPMTDTPLSPVAIPAVSVGSLPEHDPPGITTLLRTCTLRI